jgi:hypothetical protein
MARKVALQFLIYGDVTPLGWGDQRDLPTYLGTPMNIGLTILRCLPYFTSCLTEIRFLTEGCRAG